jgi:hypothetical protein
MVPHGRILGFLDRTHYSLMSLIVVLKTDEFAELSGCILYISPSQLKIYMARVEED